MATASLSRQVKTALIVEDNAPLAAALACFVAERAGRVEVTATKLEAQRCLRSTRVDVALIDLALPDGSGLELLDALWSQPAMPHVIVISGSATPEIAFRLALAGVRSFVAKPVTLEALGRVWDDVLTRSPDLRPFLRSSVGRVGLRAMEDAVRENMIEEALALADKSRRRAAGFLGISRQLLQHILRGQGERAG
jgi:two-component system, response regulator RegA